MQQPVGCTVHKGPPRRCCTARPERTLRDRAARPAPCIRPAGTAGRRGPSRPRRRAGPRPTMRRDTPRETFPGGTPPARPASGSDAAGPTPQASARAVVGEPASHILGGFSISRIRAPGCGGRLSCVSALVSPKNPYTCLEFSASGQKTSGCASFSAGKQR